VAQIGGEGRAVQFAPDQGSCPRPVPDSALQDRRLEDKAMVESNQTGLWPNLYAPFRTMQGKLAEWLSPASDASSSENAYRITMELPGVPEDAIELTVDGGVLTVTGEKADSREEQGDTWFFSEREYGAFRRSFRLPGDAVAEKAEAHVADGVLEISVPRKGPEDTKGQKIAVKRK
jgi:HSP20 family protein